MIIDALSFGAVGDGVTDDTVALQAALDATYAAGDTLYIPAGTYLVSASLDMPFDNVTPYAKGNYVFGDGMLRTIIKANADNVAIFHYDNPDAYRFMLGGKISNMTLDGAGFNGGCGLMLQGLYNHVFDTLQIKNHNNGVVINNTTSPGDSDACNHIAFDNCRIQVCRSWGMMISLATGNNETSFMSLRNTTIESCGTLSGEIGGGMYWRGQMLQFDNCAFVTNNNRGLYIEGGAGVGSNILGNNLCFENNGGKNIQCYGIIGMTLNQLQMYNGSTNPAAAGIWLNAQTTIANIRVNSAKIRVSPALTPFYAFYAAGANLSASTVVVDDKQVCWDVWGAGGQVKYSGWTVV
jgi:polygalacturonase